MSPLSHLSCSHALVTCHITLSQARPTGHTQTQMTSNPNPVPHIVHSYHITHSTLDFPNHGNQQPPTLFQFIVIFLLCSDSAYVLILCFPFMYTSHLSHLHYPQLLTPFTSLLPPTHGCILCPIYKPHIDVCTLQPPSQ